MVPLLAFIKRIFRFSPELTKSNFNASQQLNYFRRNDLIRDNFSNQKFEYIVANLL